MRRLLQIKEKQRRDAVAQLELRLKAMKRAHFGSVSSLLLQLDRRCSLDGSRSVLIAWRTAVTQVPPSGSCRTPASPSENSRSFDPAVSKTTVHSENDIIRNGIHIGPPQAPPPSHLPRDRPALRSVRSDGSVTPAQCVAGPTDGSIVGQSPLLLCRVDTVSGMQPVVARHPATQSAPSSASVCRATSAGRVPSRGQSPPPTIHTPSVQSPGMPLPPTHLLQTPSFQPVSSTGSLGVVTSGITVAGGPRVTPRNTPTPHFAVAAVPSVGGVSQQHVASTLMAPLGSATRLRHGSPLSRSSCGSLGPPPIQAPLGMFQRACLVRGPAG